MGVVSYARLGVFGLVGGVAAVSYADRAINYVETEAVVTVAETDCFVEHGKHFLAKKGSKEMAYIECDMAKYAVAQFDFKVEDIHKRTKLTYKYKSPADGTVQTGSHEDKSNDAGYKVGQKIKIYAHTSEAKYSRWS